MARPVQGQPAPWGNDLNNWLDVGHETDGSNKPFITETANWARYETGDAITVTPDQRDVALPLTYELVGVPQGPTLGDGSMLDFSGGITAPVTTGDGTHTISVWVVAQDGTPATAGSQAYIELFCSEGGNTYMDIGVMGPFQSVVNFKAPNLTLTTNAIYLPAGTLVQCKVSNLDPSVSHDYQVDFLWISKISGE